MTPPPDLSVDLSAKERERAARRLATENAPLEPALRYRALLATLEMEQEFLELADKKARFALVIMSVLNAAALLTVLRGTESVLPKTGIWAPVVQGELVLYSAVTVYYIIQAIEALRPRGTVGRPTGPLPTEVTPGISMRVLFHSDIVQRDRETFGEIWSNLRLDNLNAELADQLHIVSQINVQKYAALTRLYQGVFVMTAMVALTLATLAAYRLMQ